jgi:hypothetical protein
MIILPDPQMLKNIICKLILDHVFHTFHMFHTFPTFNHRHKFGVRQSYLRIKIK